MCIANFRSTTDATSDLSPISAKSEPTPSESSALSQSSCSTSLNILHDVEISLNNWPKNFEVSDSHMTTKLRCALRSSSPLTKAERCSLMDHLYEQITQHTL